MHLKILIWAEVHRLYQVLSESWAQNKCPGSVVTSLEMTSAWSQSWVSWFSNPDDFTKLPGRRRTGISWEQREKSGASQFVLRVKKLLEVLGMMWFWAPLPALLFLRPRVQLPPLTNPNGDGASHYCAQGPCYTQLSLRKHLLFLRGALVFPKEAEPGQASRWRQSQLLCQILFSSLCGIWLIEFWLEPWFSKLRASPFHRKYELEEDSRGPVPSGDVWSPIGQNVLNSGNKVYRVSK